MYKDNRYYEKLQSPWTDIIAFAIYNKTNCSFSFKRDSISQTAGFNYLTISGHCSDCGNEIIGTCSEKPNINSGIAIDIITSDTSSIPHSSKRQCKGVTRSLAKSKLFHKKGAAYREDEATRLMIYGDLEPPILPNALTCRKMRQEAHKEKCGFNNHDDIVKCVLTLISRGEKSIRDFSISLFHLLYWTNEQITYWNQLTSHRKKNCISIDASGRFVQTVSSYGIESSNIFLYVIVTNFEGKVIPLAQMLSAKHHSLFIKKWLQQWLESGATPPTEIVTDNSAALQNAVCMAFNKLNYHAYLSYCLQLLLRHHCELLPCFIRMDIAHLIKAVTRWKCFQDKQPIVKDFFTKCVGYMSNISEIQLFEECLTAVLIISNSQYENELLSQYKQWLLLKLENYDFSSFEEYKIIQKEDYYLQESLIKDRFDYENPDYNLVDNIPQNISTYIDNIYNKALFMIPLEGEPNTYYCPDFSKNMKNLSKQFVVWTNVMRRYYGSADEVATSADSENYFGYLRNVREFTNPLYVIQFLERHLNSINGKIKLSAAFLKNEILKKNFNHQSQLEKKIVVKQRGIHVRPQPDLSVVHEKLQSNTHKKSLKHKDIIVNANLQEPLVINKKKYVFRNSSSFDSLIELFINGYNFSCAFRKYIDEIQMKTKNSFLQIVIDFCTKESLSKFKKQRGELLLSIGAIDDDNVFCPEDIVELTIKIIYNVTNLVTKEICEFCGLTETKEAFCLVQAECPINFKEYLDQDQLNICKVCQQQMIQSNEYNGFIIFTFIKRSARLENIQDLIVQNNKKYILVGAVGKYESQKHHSTFRRSLHNNWARRDSLKSKYKKVPINKEIDVHLLLYLN